MVSGLLVLVALGGAGAVHASGGHVSAPRTASAAHTPCRPHGESVTLSSVMPSTFGNSDPFAHLGEPTCRTGGRGARRAASSGGDDFARTDAHPPVDLVIPAAPEVPAAEAPRAEAAAKPEVMVGIKHPKFIVVGQ
jgi:hypothetical protein